MSDRPLADDWWLASDGKWYPPQSRTQPPPPPPPTQPSGAPSPATASPYPAASPHAYQAPTPQRRPLSQGLTGTLMGFSIATGVLFALSGIVYFATWGLWNDFIDGGSTTFDDVLDMADTGDAFSVLALLLALVFVVLIIIWTNQAYKSAQSRGAEGRKWSSGWAVGGWFIPLANYVIPKLVINEIDRMSQPELAEPIGTTWIGLKRTAVSDWWWVFQVVGLSIANIGDSMLGNASGDIDFLLVTSFGYALAGVGFILGGVTVRTIGSRLRF